MMKCPKCGGPTTVLFISVICARCDNTAEEPGHFGYIVFRNKPPGHVEYVFQTEQDAELYRNSIGSLNALPVRRVESRAPFAWIHASQGCQAWYAEGQYKIFYNADYDHTAFPWSAHLVD